MCSVVEVCEYSVLFFEYVLGLAPCLAVVGVPVHGVWSAKVFDLGDAELPVAGLLV